MERKSSPKPIRRQEVRSIGFTRRPYDEPLTPGLRRQTPANAIGFTARIVAEDDDE